MIIKTLVEDTTLDSKYKSEHGFSLYIETACHKLLFDVGASDLFIKNAAKMNVKIEDIDTVIISLGHYDHVGGLKAFLKKNKKANIYMHKNAFDNHYSKKTNSELSYIGIDPDLINNKQIIYTNDCLYIDSNLTLFSDVTERELFSSCNNSLFMEKHGIVSLDIFDHEQNLIITEDKKTILIAGCAHNGIVNIINHYNKMYQSPLDYVFGGFHLFNYGAGISEDSNTIVGIGEFLNKYESKYYTGHCTGIEAYKQLENIMGCKIQYLATGTVVEI